MSRPRINSRKSFPPNLYVNAAGYYSWRDPDTKKTHGLGRDKATAFAEARAGNALAASREKKTLVERIRQGESKTFSQWCDEWLALPDVAKMAEKTIKNYKSAFRELKTRAGHMFLEDIKPKLIAEVLEFYVNAGKHRMSEQVHTTLFEMFRVAEVKGLIEVGKNPVAPTEPSKAKVKRVRLELDEFLKVHAAQKSHWGATGDGTGPGVGPASGRRGRHA